MIKAIYRFWMISESLVKLDNFSAISWREQVTFSEMKMFALY